MFTGLIEEIGSVAARQMKGGNLLLTIKAKDILQDLRPGDSVAVNGPCLTVTELQRDRFKVEASAHTVAHSTIGGWQVGKRVNLERALKVGDRLGGHIVQGHVDGIGRAAKIRYGEGSTDIYIEAPTPVIELLAPRGSVAVDGVSLTLAEKTPRSFRLMIIPYTLQHTCLKDLKPGDSVNIETDLIIRWLADRFKDGEVTGDAGGLSSEFNIHLED
ncbi:MAG TPA: riboflavin synthase [Bacteroidetes bacterium]|nr:riboflavin synthase [Bacteroidota bacterium]